MTHPFLLFLDVGGGELLLILLAVFLLFGPKKIPEIARGIGKGMYELNKVTRGIKEEFEKGKEGLEKDIVENPENKETGKKTDHENDIG
jgi:sec-independent protein translocase protein TatA